MRQEAVNPVSVIERSVGENAPMKLGCGQSDVSETRVSRAAGAKVSEVEPVKFKSALNLKGAMGVAPSPTSVFESPSFTWMPFKAVVCKRRLGSKGRSSLSLILRVAA